MFSNVHQQPDNPTLKGFLTKSQPNAELPGPTGAAAELKQHTADGKGL